MNSHSANASKTQNKAYKYLMWSRKVTCEMTEKMTKIEEYANCKLLCTSPQSEPLARSKQSVIITAIN